MPFDLSSWLTPGMGGTALAPKPKAPVAAAPNASAISLEKMLSEASSLAGIEDQRHATEYGRMDKAGRDYASGFNEDESRLTGLATGASLDAIGNGAQDQSRMLRSQLGGRGIDPSSGTAAALANRIGQQQQALKYGAMRNAAMDSYQRRNAFRTAQYAQQAGLAQFGNQSPSLLRLDALTNQAEFDLAREVSANQLDAAKYAAKKNAQAAKSNAIGDVIKGVFSAL